MISIILSIHRATLISPFKIFSAISSQRSPLKICSAFLFRSPVVPWFSRKVITQNYDSKLFMNSSLPSRRPDLRIYKFDFWWDIQHQEANFFKQIWSKFMKNGQFSALYRAKMKSSLRHGQSKFMNLAFKYRNPTLYPKDSLIEIKFKFDRYINFECDSIR